MINLNPTLKNNRVKTTQTDLVQKNWLHRLNASGNRHNCPRVEQQYKLRQTKTGGPDWPRFTIWELGIGWDFCQMCDIERIEPKPPKGDQNEGPTQGLSPHYFGGAAADRGEFWSVSKNWVEPAQFEFLKNLSSKARIFESTKFFEGHPILGMLRRRAHPSVNISHKINHLKSAKQNRYHPGPLTCCAWQKRFQNLQIRQKNVFDGITIS